MSEAVKPRLYTWSWKPAMADDSISEEAVLVRISLGKPRWVSAAITSQIPYIPEAAPSGLLQIQDWDQFTARYHDRLDHYGAGLFDHYFDRIRDEHGGLPLILLCYEKDRSECHRGLFADWWLKETGEIIPEWDADPAEAQMVQGRLGDGV